jgi:hypothetical protein
MMLLTADLDMANTVETSDKDAFLTDDPLLILFLFKSIKHIYVPIQESAPLL